MPFIKSWIFFLCARGLQMTCSIFSDYIPEKVAEVVHENYRLGLNCRPKDSFLKHRRCSGSLDLTFLRLNPKRPYMQKLSQLETSKDNFLLEHAPLSAAFQALHLLILCVNPSHRPLFICWGPWSTSILQLFTNTRAVPAPHPGCHPAGRHKDSKHRRCGNCSHSQQEQVHGDLLWRGLPALLVLSLPSKHSLLFLVSVLLPQTAAWEESFLPSYPQIPNTSLCHLPERICQSMLEQPLDHVRLITFTGIRRQQGNSAVFPLKLKQDTSKGQKMFLLKTF